MTTLKAVFRERLSYKQDPLLSMIMTALTKMFISSVGVCVRVGVCVSVAVCVSVGVRVRVGLTAKVRVKV